jgi:hypothetical protein
MTKQDRQDCCLLGGAFLARSLSEVAYDAPILPSGCVSTREQIGKVPARAPACGQPDGRLAARSARKSR